MNKNHKENEVGKFMDLMAEMIENDIDEFSTKGVINNSSNSKITLRYGVNIKLGKRIDNNIQEDIKRIVDFSSSNNDK
jgi:hypothetical protein